MDIDLLSKLVKELIMDHDEVALPGVGTFVAELVPSSFSDRGYTINPPYRRLYFRQRANEDNLLTGFYLKANNLSADSAEGKVAEQGMLDFLKEMRELLLEKKTITFPGLGRLRSTRENNFFFIPDEDLDIYPAGFGLEPISLKTHEETPEEVSAAVAGLASMIDEAPLTEEAVGPDEAAPEEPVSEGIVKEEAEPAAPAESFVQEPEIAQEAVVPEPEVELETEPEAVVPEPEAELEAEPEAVVPEPEAEPEAEVEPVKKNGKAWLWIIIGIIAAAAIFLLALMILGRVAPDLVDRFLYSEDELRIINY